jgi:integrase
LGELQPSHFLDLQTTLVNGGKAPGTTDRVLILCRYICNCAIKWKVPGIKANPTADVPLLHVDNTKQRFLSDAETRRLLATLEDARHGPIRPIVLLLFLTGARRGEVLNARWDEFDLERRIWRIPETKSGRPRTVPLSVSAVELLAELKRATNSPFVCPNRETGKPFVQVHKAWKRLCRDADLHDLRMHDLRHNFASYLVNNSRTLYEVQRILGHSNIKITERYAHLAHESLLEAADTVGALIANANQAAPGRAPAQA